MRFNLSKLSVWWLRLGIEIKRIKPGCPQQNGRHERMHLTLKLETTKPAGQNFLQQCAVGLPPCSVATHNLGALFRRLRAPQFPVYQGIYREFLEIWLYMRA